MKRALIVFDWRSLATGQLALIADLSQQHDELILLIHRDTIIASGYEGMSCGQLMVSLTQRLSTQLTKPFYLFPVSGDKADDLHYWLRCKILAPAFKKVYTDNPDWQQAAKTALRLPVEYLPRHGDGPPANQSAAGDDNITRGLFITRAQPFHLGHAAFLQQLAAEQNEIIVIIAMANRSHQPEHPATAGERMEMLLPWLEQNFPRRYYLVPLPYSSYIMENIYELEHLIPPFHHVYTINTEIMSMSATAGYPSSKLEKQLDISGTLIRQSIVNDLPYRAYLPDSVYEYLQSSPIPQRIKILHQKESR